MSDIISVTDILDEDLSPLSMDADFENVTSWYSSFCREQNVASADIELDPLPYECKRAAVFWVSCEIARRNVGKNITTTASGAQTDWYEKKLKIYEKELEKALSACTPAVIKGTVTEDDDNSEAITVFERA